MYHAFFVILDTTSMFYIRQYQHLLTFLTTCNLSGAWSNNVSNASRSHRIPTSSYDVVMFSRTMRCTNWPDDFCTTTTATETCSGRRTGALKCLTSATSRCKIDTRLFECIASTLHLFGETRCIPNTYTNNNSLISEVCIDKVGI